MPTIPLFPFAYLDPGSGSMLVQGLLGGSAALVVLVRLGWNYLRCRLLPTPPEPDREGTAQ